jgi:iron complex outermembrane receptor protein
VAPLRALIFIVIRRGGNEMAHRLLLSTVSLAALAVCSSVHAQAASSGSNTSAGVEVGAVVITAERRSVNLQRAAVAATVVSGADLVKKGVVGVDQLQFISPDLTVTDFGQGNLFNIRGIGRSNGSSNVQSGVVTYRDGVATFPGYFQSEPYYDIANVEVLRGPQGTFAGQNATGGAIFITETDPSLSAGYHGYAQAQVGNYSDYGFQGAINIPISDTLALRVAENTEYRDSFYTITGAHTGTPGKLAENSARVSLLWQPNTHFKALLKVDSNDVSTGGYAADPATSTENLFHIGNNAYNEARDTFGRVVLNMSYTFDNGLVLRSISGYQKGTTTAALDDDGTNSASDTFVDRGDEDIYSEEVNLISPDSGPLTWIAGAYYQYNLTTFPTGHFETVEPNGPGTALHITLSGANPETSTAVFGQVTYKITPAIQVQVGLRYTDSNQRNDAVAALFETTPLPAPFNVIPLLRETQNAREEDSKVTGKIGLNWTIDRDNFVYAFVATGHKGGGINAPNIAGLNPTIFKPEDVTDYELGWKSTLADGHLRTQLGGFYSEYQNFQISIQDPTEPVISELYNIPSSTKLYGVEGSAQAVFGDLSFDAGAAYLHSEIGTFYANNPSGPQPMVPAVCNASSGPATAYCVNLAGKPTSYAPEFTGNIGGQYIFHLANDLTLTPRVDYSHTDAQWATLFEDAALGDHLPARNLVNAQVSLDHDGWLLTAYATNLTNQEYVAAVGSGLRYAGPPRQYGLRLRKSF